MSSWVIAHSSLTQASLPSPQPVASHPGHVISGQAGQLMCKPCLTLFPRPHVLLYQASHPGHIISGQAGQLMCKLCLIPFPLPHMLPYQLTLYPARLGDWCRVKEWVNDPYTIVVYWFGQISCLCSYYGPRRSLIWLPPSPAGQYQPTLYPARPDRWVVDPTKPTNHYCNNMYIY